MDEFQTGELAASLPHLRAGAADNNDNSGIEMMTNSAIKVTQKVQQRGLKQLAGLLLLTLATAGAEAASYAGTQFEIEMVVFARDNGMNQSRENWPSAPHLAYDDRWVDFDTPSRSNPMSPQLLPAPNQLDNKVAALKRSAGYRVLFHKTWRQVLQQERNAPAVLISGGAPSDNHHELEGSVTLSVSRYLHLSTDLWLSEWLPQSAEMPTADNSGFGYQQAATAAATQGIRVPTRPRAAISVNSSLAGEEPLSLGGTQSASESNGYGTASTTDNYANGTDAAVFRSGNRFSDTPIGESVDPAEHAPSEKLAARVAVLQEERRLRSGELHYIDHPKLGVLIEVRTVAQQQEPSSDDLQQDEEPLDLN
ncbi:CsiV family protein [Microbulbifer sp. ALW1]|uniref:CsiV family protein n=1 Tax=Microbulbifer sp. (strain ALW1) TaxID=1516059 RepID=UPI00135C008A|nr:CsiV family protein [Microbulbifer sp. ALW1]